MQQINNNSIMVSIHCCAYNHEKYIRQCLEGFVMQRTNFKFEVIVHDDASTDKTATIIKECADKYPDIIKPIYQKENQYSTCKENIDIALMAKTSGKYIALCEGDDYWIDPYKLQKQVDFLENNSDYVLSHTGFQYLVEYSNNEFRDSNEATKKNLEIIKNDLPNIIEHILNYNEYRIQTATVLYRKDAFIKTQKDKKRQNEPFFLMGDTPLWVRLYQYGKIHFLQDDTTIYRQHLNSACRETINLRKLRFNLSCAEMRTYFASLYNINQTYKEKFEKDYKAKLFEYMIYDQSYKPFIKVYHNITDRCLFYNIILTRPCLLLIKPFYLLSKFIKISNFKKNIKKYILNK